MPGIKGAISSIGRAFVKPVTKEVGTGIKENLQMAFGNPSSNSVETVRTNLADNPSDPKKLEQQRNWQNVNNFITKLQSEEQKVKQQKQFDQQQRQQKEQEQKQKGISQFDVKNPKDAGRSQILQAGAARVERSKKKF